MKRKFSIHDYSPVYNIVEGSIIDGRLEISRLGIEYRLEAAMDRVKELTEKYNNNRIKGRTFIGFEVDLKCA